MNLLDRAHAIGSRAFPARTRRGLTLAGAALAAAALVAPEAARADKISHPIAIFDGLDKITGRIISFEVGINETVQFGALQITPRVCYSRPLTEAPQTDAFAQVDEIDEEKKLKRIFSGWMFADSPGLHGIEHPIFDIWLTGCKGGTVVIHDAPTERGLGAQPGRIAADRHRRRSDRDHGAAGPAAEKEKAQASAGGGRGAGCGHGRAGRPPAGPAGARQRPGAVNWPTTGLATATRGVPLGFTQKQGTLACPEAFRSR